MISRSTNPARAGARLHTVEAVAERLGLSDKTIRRRITDGDLVAHRIGRRLRISEQDLQAFLAVSAVSWHPRNRCNDN